MCVCVYMYFKKQVSDRNYVEESRKICRPPNFILKIKNRRRRRLSTAPLQKQQEEKTCIYTPGQGITYRGLDLSFAMVHGLYISRNDSSTCQSSTFCYSFPCPPRVGSFHHDHTLADQTLNKLTWKLDRIFIKQ